MADQKEIKYTTVKCEDIASAMKSSRNAAIGEKKSKNANAIVWNQTVTIAMERVDMADIIPGTDKETIQKNGDVIRGILANHIQATTVIPEKGDDRNGNEFTIVGSKGPQWSKWDQSRRIMDYAGTIAKCLSFGVQDELYPEQYKVAARCDILKKCVVTEKPIDGVVRLAADLQGNLDKMTVVADVLQAQHLVSGLVVNNLDIEIEMRDLVAKLGSLLDVASDSEKAGIQQDLLKVAVKHFE